MNFQAGKSLETLFILYALSHALTHHQERGRERDWDWEKAWREFTSQWERGLSPPRTLKPAPGAFPEIPSSYPANPPNLNSVRSSVCLYFDLTFPMLFVVDALLIFFFKFWFVDQIFGDDCKTRDVYSARTGDIVAAAVRGFNGLFSCKKLFILVIWMIQISYLSLKWQKRLWTVTINIEAGSK